MEIWCSRPGVPSLLAPQTRWVALSWSVGWMEPHPPGSCPETECCCPLSLCTGIRPWGLVLPLPGPAHRDLGLLMGQEIWQEGSGSTVSPAPDFWIHGKLLRPDATVLQAGSNSWARGWAPPVLDQSERRTFSLVINFLPFEAYAQGPI